VAALRGIAWNDLPELMREFVKQVNNI
jgi:hypothetical protein